MSGTQAVFVFLSLLPSLPSGAWAQNPQSTRLDRASLTTDLSLVAGVLAERRGMKTEGLIQVGVLPPEEFRAALLRQITELHPPGHFQSIEQAYTMLGLMPKTFDAELIEVVADNLASAIFGLYSPVTKQVLIPDKLEHPAYGEEEGAAFRMEILAHEVQHVLQDKRWGLAKIIGRGAGSHDRRLAANALMEGDAVAASFDWTMRYTDSGFLDWDGDLGKRITDNIEIAAVMQGAQEGMFHDTTVHAFLYGQGAAFVQHLTRAGEWAQVDAAWEDLPDSTEQILHPEKYLGERDYPVELPLTIPPALQEAGWKIHSSDVLGELNLRILFASAIDETAAWKASMGWDGDRYLVLAKDGHRSLIWISQWDSRSDARAAARALDETYGLQALEARKGWSANLERTAGPTTVQVAKDRVALVVGLPGALVEEAIGSAIQVKATFDPRDEDRGRGDSKVTRRLEREVQARFEAEAVTIADQAVFVREVGLSFPLPNAEWSLGDRSQFPVLKALVIRKTPSVNLNVTTAPTQGLDREQTIQATLDSLPTAFADFQVLSQSNHEREQGPGFDLRFSGYIAGQIAHLWQRAFLRGDDYVVLTATNMGGPIEGDLEAEFGSMLDGARFKD